VGVALDVIYSRRAGYLAAESAERVLGLLEALGHQLFTTDLLAKNARQEFLVLEGLEEFREHLGGRLAITLLREIGIGFEMHEMNAPLIRESIQELRTRHEGRSGEKIAT
jgi:3-dehydroquinate synthase